jgi:beta-glucuronidase
VLYPQQNNQRNVFDLSGFWDFKRDPDCIGETEGWFDGLIAPRTIAVPGSWNEQFQDTRDYLGTAWYVREVYIPHGWEGQRVFIRVGSANYAAKVWVNGTCIGEHEGGHLPFAFEITGHVMQDGPNVIAIRVENELKPTRVPPGNVKRGGLSSFMRNYPPTSFDFFPYAGLHRPVLLYAVPQVHIEDVTVTTDIADTEGHVKVRVVAQGAKNGEVTLNAERGAPVRKCTLEFDDVDGVAEVTLKVPDARFWSPDDPYLYKLTVELLDSDKVVDCYTLDVGIRTIAVEGDTLLLNGEPIFLKGFGKHEDFPVHGRGLNMPLVVKDYALLKWVGANSYRTSHYPYSEEAMCMADREGILIVDEIPAVGLFFGDDEEGIQARLSQCKQQIQELIARDKNHPSVIMWSVANEPHTIQGNPLSGGKPEPDPRAKSFFAELFNLVRELDPTRLATLVSMVGAADVSLEFADVVFVNRYNGWYTQSGRIAQGIEALEQELDMIHQTFNKPIVISEFGTDTVAGMHSDPPEMFTEEYQVAFLRHYLDMAARKPYIVGLHVWNFADFKTSQGVIRVGGLNLKGVFTRDRRPKMAAHFLRERWAT